MLLIVGAPTVISPLVNNAPPIPTPPVTTNAPVDEVVDALLNAIETCPAAALPTVIDPVVNSVNKLAVPVVTFDDIDAVPLAVFPLTVKVLLIVGAPTVILPSV